MTPTPYSESNLVQNTMAEYVERQLGWKSVYAHNKENFGAQSLLGRTSEREVVLTRILRAKLVELNPGLPDAAYNDAVRQITASTASQTTLAANREKYNLMRDGITVSYRNDDNNDDGDGEPQRQRLRVFDFDAPQRNDFLCVRELWVQGDLYRRRIDIVGFVNGLPLLFVECKNIHKNLKVAFEKNYSDNRDTIPHLFHHNAFVMFCNGDAAKLGSITSKWEHFHEWKRLSEEQPGVVGMETMLKGVCAKHNFMDLLENFILFDSSAGETKKILARNHQFLGVNRVVEAVRERDKCKGKLGVFWHTQGAGKSYSMVLFTRKVHRKLGGHFTFLVLTDRDDLDTQIYKTFAGCGVVNHDQDACRASDGAHLNRLLGEQKKHVFSLIQKFNREVNAHQGYTQRDDIIVISDEAHRTQYGTLALNMRNALPNAAYIGFTGTPLFKDDEKTRHVFGDYVSTYDFQRAVDDGATVPLFYEARGDDLNLSTDDLNERIANTLDQFEMDDINVEQRLAKELERDYHVITAEKRLKEIAQDFVNHYSTAWQSGKAMLICIDKITCVRMYNFIKQCWQARIQELQKDSEQKMDEQEDADCRQLVWMRDTRMAVVISEEQGEVEKFRREHLDITPHRKLIKSGMELPESMRNTPQYRNMQRMEIDDAFKEEQHPFRIAIVCAMWLTGFDVPCLSTLYLDKPLKAHTLMQAIARANRVHEGKVNGVIVDYCGILKHLHKALATFAGVCTPGRNRKIEPMRPIKKLLGELAEAIALVKDFLAKRGASLVHVIQANDFNRNAAIVACKEAVNENDETRKRFEIMCREVFKKFQACINVRNVNKHRKSRDAIHIIYNKLREDLEQADIRDVIRRVQLIVDDVIDTRKNMGDKHEKIDLSDIDFEQLSQAFAKSKSKRTTVQSMKAAVEKKLQQLLAQNPLRSDFQKRYEDIIAQYNRDKDPLTNEQALAALLKLAQDLDHEEKRAVRENLDEESLAIFDLLCKENLSTAEIKRIKKVAIDLLAMIKEKIARMDQWREKEMTRDAVRISIHDFLYSEQTGLPDVYPLPEVKQKTEQVFQHVLYAYQTAPSPLYPSNAA